MPRQPRYSLAGIPQHVIQRGNNRQATFFAEQDYRIYLACLKEACEIHGGQVHAYVLMTNHVHLLLSPSQPATIAKVMQSLGRRYVRYINDTYRRTGTLWEGRYKASLIDSDHYLLACYRYIEMNPMRANRVPQPHDYAWSGHGYHIGECVTDLIEDHALYLALGRTGSERHTAYRALFRTQVDDVIMASIRASTNQCRVLGSERFKDQIEEVVSRRVRPGKAGRPKKEIAV